MIISANTREASLESIIIHYHDTDVSKITGVNINRLDTYNVAIREFNLFHHEVPLWENFARLQTSISGTRPLTSPGRGGYRRADVLGRSGPGLGGPLAPQLQGHARPSQVLVQPGPTFRCRQSLTSSWWTPTSSRTKMTPSAPSWSTPRPICCVPSNSTGPPATTRAKPSASSTTKPTPRYSTTSTKESTPSSPK